MRSLRSRCIAFFLLLSPIVALQAEQAGELIFATDPFEVSVIRESEQLLFEPGGPVYGSDTIVTEASSAEVDLFTVDATLHVAPGTQLRVDSVADSAARVSEDTGRSRVELIAGKLRATIRDDRTNPLAVTSRVGVAGVRGTDFVMEIEGDTVRLAVRTGEVEYAHSYTGATAILRSGEGIDVDNPFAERIEAGRWSEERLNNFFESVGGYE